MSLECLRFIASWRHPAHRNVPSSLANCTPKPASQRCQSSAHFADWRQVPNLKYLIHLWADQVGYDMNTGPPSEKVLSKAAIQARHMALSATA